MDAHLIIAGGGHSGMGVARAEAILQAMEEPCLFFEPSPAPHATQGEAPSPPSTRATIGTKFKS